MYSPAALPSSRRAAPAKKRRWSTHGGSSSERNRARGFPTLADSRLASSTPSALTASANFSNISLRSLGTVSNHSGYALRAALTARSTSASVPFGTSAMVSPVAGLMIGWPSLPAPATHSPPMNISPPWTALAILLSTLLSSCCEVASSPNDNEHQRDCPDQGQSRSGQASTAP